MNDLMASMSKKKMILFFIFSFLELTSVAVIVLMYFLNRAQTSIMLCCCILVGSSIIIKGYLTVNELMRPMGYIISRSNEMDKEHRIDMNAGFEERFIEIADAISKDSKSTMLLAQAEMYALQNQINPHFLYNTLDVIRSMAVKQDADDISEMTEALSNIFRYEISKPGEMATLDEEVLNVKNYITIQKYRFGDKIEVQWIIDDDYNSIKSLLLPILTLQPIVENAIHHGLETKIGHGVVQIHIFSSNNRLTVEIGDYGVGIKDEQLNKIVEIINTPFSLENKNQKRVKNKSGIALMNVNQRIKFYYGQDYGITISSTYGIGTKVTLIIPIK